VALFCQKIHLNTVENNGKDGSQKEFKKDLPLFILEAKSDLEVLATVSLRTEKEACFYSVFYKALINTNEDLTWRIIFLNPKSRKLLESKKGKILQLGRQVQIG